ncbi:hypothetical protein DERP_011653 [Dermatophagoides pteronyssinus]|uniref:MYND-type domain-containing protein n=1 Tax=Dermatophagoides pteronyssinus TaxID=6956 RepID=A0ABQ8JWI2_DERPT|nr:hypothetical protein DERP_011653 [Dermatophagoides pteronyssinus]
MTSHRDYQAGEIISISLPFIHVVTDNLKGKICDYCFVECKNNELGKCSRCKKMFYCGKECQQKDWIRHKFECKFFRKKYEPLTHAYLQIEWIDEFFRLVLRLYLYITENPESIYEQYKLLNDENSSICLNDIRNWNCPVIYPKRIMNVEKFSNLLKIFQIEHNIDILYKCFAIGAENFFKIYDYRMKEIGSGLYLAESKFQHCCQPNTKLLYNGIQLVMRSIKSIRNGEQIFINNIRYCDINGQIFWSPTDKHYYFTYKCGLCMNLERFNEIDSEQSFKNLRLEILRLKN